MSAIRRRTAAFVALAAEAASRRRGTIKKVNPQSMVHLTEKPGERWASEQIHPRVNRAREREVYHSDPE